MVIYESERPVSPATLDALERAYEFRFPEQYREFLLKHNGGRLEPSKFNYLEMRGPYTDSLVNWLFSVYDGEANNFEWYLRTLKINRVRMPLNLIPIGSDPFGNIICISTSGKDVGAVYFWDHEKEQDPDSHLPPTWDNVFLIARSFDEFLVSLH